MKLNLFNSVKPTRPRKDLVVDNTAMRAQDEKYIYAYENENSPRPVLKKLKDAVADGNYTYYYDEETGRVTRTKAEFDALQLVVSGNWAGFTFGVGDIVIDWGDGTVDSVTTTFQDYLFHNYAEVGVYVITIKGTLAGFDGDYSESIVRIESFGELNLEQLCLSGEVNLESIPDRLPPTVTDTTYTWGNGGMFSFANITPEMEQSMQKWDVSNVEYFDGMFYDNEAEQTFNTDLSGWDIRSAISLQDMFRANVAFNQDITGWNTSSVTNMTRMFKDCSSFNQNISSWNTSNVTTMDFMFSGAMAFDQSLSNWNTSNVTTMNMMFGATFVDMVFNSDISGWDVSNVTDMRDMFESCVNFNVDISGWNVAGVTTMTGMFNGASSFNQDLSGWCVTNIGSLPFQFDSGTIAWSLPKPVWGTCP